MNDSDLDCCAGDYRPEDFFEGLLVVAAQELTQISWFTSGGSTFWEQRTAEATRSIAAIVARFFEKALPERDPRRQETGLVVPMDTSFDDFTVSPPLTVAGIPACLDGAHELIERVASESRRHFLPWSAFAEQIQRRSTQVFRSLRPLSYTFNPATAAGLPAMHSLVPGSLYGVHVPAVDPGLYSATVRAVSHQAVVVESVKVVERDVITGSRGLTTVSGAVSAIMVAVRDEVFGPFGDRVPNVNGWRHIYPWPLPMVA